MYSPAQVMSGPVRCMDAISFLATVNLRRTLSDLVLLHFLLEPVFFFFKQKTAYELGLGIPAEPLFRSGAIAGGIASALAGGAMSKLFGGGQKAASGGIQGDVLATDNNTVGMGDAGIKSAIQGSNVPNPDEAVPSFVSGAMAKAGK